MLLWDFKIGCSTNAIIFLKYKIGICWKHITCSAEGKIKHQIGVIWVLQNQIPINNTPNINYGGCKLIQVI